MNDRTSRALPIAVASFLFTALTACSGGVNAGEKGGQAFILLTIMLLLILGILWFVLGRER